MSTRATRLCQNQYLILYRVEEMVGKGCPETRLLLRMEAFRNEEQLLPHYPSPGLFLSALLDLWIWGCSSDALSRNSVPTQTQILCSLKVNQIPSVNMGNFLLDSFLVLWPQLKNPLRAKLSLSHWWGWQPKQIQNCNLVLLLTDPPKILRFWESQSYEGDSCSL